MKKQPINYSWPANLSDFSKDEKQENFSRGKLEVFYQGETADHRFFSKEFAEELVKSLPYTPVVSYYDEEKKDFVGHATEQQIFGIVDPCVQPTFEQREDGNTWCICDVVLYTERPDKVGDLAKKIVGHSQSLELDPASVKYTINYDEKKHFKNIEFTAGRFVGVSVLGNDQKPAFTGSEFFAYNEEIEQKMQILRNYCEGKDQLGNQTQNGGEQMNFNEFMKLSWGDISLKVAEAINKSYENDAFIELVDMYDDSAIVHAYYYIEGSCKLLRVAYKYDSETDSVQLGKVNEVRVTYEDIEIVEPAPADTTKEETDISQAQIEDVQVEPAEPQKPAEGAEIAQAAEGVQVDGINATDITLHEDAVAGAKPEVEEDQKDQNNCEVENGSDDDDKKKKVGSIPPSVIEDKEGKKKDGDGDSSGTSRTINDSPAEPSPESTGSGGSGADTASPACECGTDKTDEKSDCGCGENVDKKDQAESAEEAQKAESNCTEETFKNDENKPAQDENVEDTPADEKKVSVENTNGEENNYEKESNSSSTSFTDSEKAEFEALKREKKIALVDSYKEDISSDDYSNFIANIDSYDETKLELDLLKAYKANVEDSNKKPMRAFAFAPEQNNAKTESSLGNWIRKNLK